MIFLEQFEKIYNVHSEEYCEKNVTVYYSLIMALYSIGFVAMSAFSSFYLLNNGLSRYPEYFSL